MARLTPFHTGYCTHPSCIALRGSGFASRCFPSQAWLIESRAGLVLWDTGYSSHFLEASARGIYRLYPRVTPVTFEPSQALVVQLKARGIAARDISTIVLSHFHADHMAGLRDFPNAQVIASASGWESVRHARGWRALRQAFLPGLVPLDIETRLQFVEQHPLLPLPAALRPFETGFDVLGTGELLVVPLPGHAKGHVGAFVAADDGWTLLASDAAWAHEAYTDLIGPSVVSFLVQDNRRAYYDTLGRLQALVQGGAARIELSHVASEALA